MFQPSMATFLYPNSYTIPHGCHSALPPLRRRPKMAVVCAKRDRSDRSSWGKKVDEDMVVLRKRLYEMKAIEEGGGPKAPDEWMEWEKRYYEAMYSYDVAMAVGVLQTWLMNTRPSVVVGVLGLVLVSVPTTMVVVVMQLVEVVNKVFLQH